MWRSKPPAERGEKPDRRPLGPRAINMHLILLSAILDNAEERHLIDRNPASGRTRAGQGAPTKTDTARHRNGNRGSAVGRRRARPRGCDAPADREAARAAAGDRGDAAAGRPANWRAGRGPVGRHRPGERPHPVRLQDARWLPVGAAAARPETTNWRRSRRSASRPAATTCSAPRAARRQSESNIRNRVLTQGGRTCQRATGRGRGRRLSPTSRHTAAGAPSRRSATPSGASPTEVMAELGHTDPSLALAVYAQAMRMSDEEKLRLRALVDGTLDSLGSRKGQVDVRESPQIATIKSEAGERGENAGLAGERPVSHDTPQTLHMLAMQKVEGSSPFSRSQKNPAQAGFSRL